MIEALKRAWREDQGVLTFEWILLATLLVLGIVGGLSAVRDALIDELGDVAGAAVAMDQSFSVTTCPADPCLFQIGSFTDTAAQVARGRPNPLVSQPKQ